MQPVSRLIQNKYLSPLIQLARQLHTLQLAAGKRRHRLIQMQVTESDLYQRIEFLHKIRIFKELDRLTDGHIHDFRNILSLYTDIFSTSSEYRVPWQTSQTVSIESIYAISDIITPFTLTRRAGALGIETEICLCDMVRFSRKAPGSHPRYPDTSPGSNAD